MQLRKHFDAALEQQDIEPSTQELEQMEHGDLVTAGDIASDMDEVRRLSDIADSLEDTVMAMESITKADFNHLRLVEAVLNAAHAGTSQRADGVIPSLENYAGSTISTEGVVNTIKNILEQIRRILRELWHKIKDFFITLFNEVGRLKFRIQYVSTLLDEIDGKEPEQDTVTLGNTAYGVCTEQGIPQNARAVVISLMDMLNQTRAVRQHYVPQLIAIGEGLARTLPQWPNDPERNKLWLEQLNSIASGFNTSVFAHSVAKTFPTNNPNWPAGSAQVGTPLPGFRSLVFVNGEKVATDQSASPQAHAMRIQASQVLLTRARQTHNVDLAKATIETFSNDHLKEILDLVSQIVEEVETGMKAGLRNKLERLGRDLDNAAAKIDQETDGDIGTLKRGLRYATVFAGWTTDPYVQLLGHDLYVCRSMLSFVSRHIAAHHKTKA